MDIKNSLQTEIFSRIGNRHDIRIDELPKDADLDKITKDNGRSEFIVKTNTDRLVAVSSSSFAKETSQIKVGDKIKFSDNLEVEVVKKDKEMSKGSRIFAASSTVIGGALLATGFSAGIANYKLAVGTLVAGTALSAVGAGYILLNKKLNDTSELDKASLKTVTIKAPPPVKAAPPQPPVLNKTSIYGPNVTVENAKQWLSNNPEHVKNPKLLQIADYENDGVISPENLSQAATAGTVVLNGVKSFYIPGEKAAETEKAQTELNKARKAAYDAENARRTGETIGNALGLAALLGGAVLDEVNRTIK